LRRRGRRSSPAEADRYTLGVQSLFLICLRRELAGIAACRIGKKRMPATPRDRFWACMERIGSMQRVLGDVIRRAARPGRLAHALERPAIDGTERWLKKKSLAPPDDK
jgi:hypothetical protein